MGSTQIHTGLHTYMLILKIDSCCIHIHYNVTTINGKGGHKMKESRNE